MAKLRQGNFAAGELAPQLYGRSDLPQYAAGLAAARNFITTPDGQLVNRPGTTYVNEVKNSSKRTRGIPFTFSDDQSYSLEFGDLYFRVHYRGAYLGVEVATTYAETDLFRLAYTQAGDVLTIAHPSYPPREVKRTAHTTWSIADKAFNAVQAAPTAPGNNLLDVATAPLKPWSWAITAVDANGQESLPVAYTPAASHVTAATPAEIKWTAPASGTVVLYNIYRGQSGVKGYVGSAVGLVFRDDGQDPDFGQQPPTFPNPFGSADNYPAAVAYHDQRLVFANTNNNPNKVWASVVGNFRLFESHMPPLDDDAAIFALANKRYEEVRALASSKLLIALTNAAEYPVTGASGPEEALSATSVRAVPHSKVGSSRLAPLESDEVLLFVEERGSRVRDLAFNFQVGGYSGNDLSIFAHHLVDGHTIVDWAYTRNPFGIVWAVRDDGVLLGMTYQREQQVFAWHRHDTQGFFESCWTVPEGTEDVLYLVVKRTINGSTKRFVERMASRQVSDARYGVFVDAAVVFDGHSIGDTVTLTGGTTWTVGETIDVEASGAIFTGSDTYFVVAPDTAPVRCIIAFYFSTTHALVAIESGTIPPALRGVATTKFGFARILRFVPHLKGQAVAAICDGNIDSGTVDHTSGELDLNVAGVVQCVGLSYVTQAEQLDVAFDAKRGAAKLISRLTLEIELALTGSGRVGGTGALTDASQQTPLGPIPAPVFPGPVLVTPRNLTVRVQGHWERGARAMVQGYPGLPITVLAMTRDVDFGTEP